jgi:hypothetical protein
MLWVLSHIKTKVRELMFLLIHRLFLAANMAFVLKSVIIALCFRKYKKVVLNLSVVRRTLSESLDHPYCCLAQNTDLSTEISFRTMIWF